MPIPRERTSSRPRPGLQPCFLGEAAGSGAGAAQLPEEPGARPVLESEDALRRPRRHRASPQVLQRPKRERPELQIKRRWVTTLGITPMSVCPHGNINGRVNKYMGKGDSRHHRRIPNNNGGRSEGHGRGCPCCCEQDPPAGAAAGGSELQEEPVSAWPRVCPGSSRETVVGLTQAHAALRALPREVQLPSPPQASGLAHQGLAYFSGLGRGGNWGVAGDTPLVSARLWAQSP